MDSARNPFTPTPGARPPVLAGRGTETDACVLAATRLGNGFHARSLVVTGLRGVGKTVLLGEFGELVEGLGWACGRTVAAPNRSFPAEVAELAGNALLVLSRGEASSHEARQAAAALKSFRACWKLPEGGDLQIGVDPVEGLADSGLFHHDLADLFGQVGALARQRGAGAFFTIDEIQALGKRELSALIVALHRISQDGLPLLVAAAGLPAALGLMADAAPYAERLFEFQAIGNLGPEEAHEALTAPAEVAGIRFRREAAARIVELTSGYPYFLQEFGRAAWDTATGSEAITLEEVEAAAPTVLARLDEGFFRVLFDRSPPAARALLLTMASLGAGPYPKNEIETAAGLPASTFASRLDSLRRSGLCAVSRHGEVEFTVPLFDRFLRREAARAADRN